MLIYLNSENNALKIDQRFVVLTFAWSCLLIMPLLWLQIYERTNSKGDNNRSVPMYHGRQKCTQCIF